MPTQKPLFAMIDIETLASEPRAQIVSIGAVVFNEAGVARDGHFEVNVRPQVPLFPSRLVPFPDFCPWRQSVDLHLLADRATRSRGGAMVDQVGGVISAQTLDWWRWQDPRAIDALFSPAPVDLTAALALLGRWWSSFGGDIAHMWSHATFDAVALREAHKALDWSTPWPWKDVCDLRTLFKLRDRPKLALPGGHVRHRALHDAIRQALQAAPCLAAQYAGRRPDVEQLAEALPGGRLDPLEYFAP